MKYAILVVTNGTYLVKEEGITDPNKAKVSFHKWCQTYWSAQDVLSATVMIADENLDAVEGYKEHIFHTVESAEEE